MKIYLTHLSIWAMKTQRVCCLLLTINMWITNKMQLDNSFACKQLNSVCTEDNSLWSSSLRTDDCTVLWTMMEKKVHSGAIPTQKHMTEVVIPKQHAEVKEAVVSTEHGSKVSYDSQQCCLHQLQTVSCAVEFHHFANLCLKKLPCLTDFSPRNVIAGLNQWQLAAEVWGTNIT